MQDGKMCEKMKRPKFRSIYRKVESVFLGILFFSLAILLYQVLITDHVTVMGWFGLTVSVNTNTQKQPLSPLTTATVHSFDEVVQHKTNPPKTRGSQENKPITIAIGCAITSKKLDSLSVTTVAYVSPFLRTFLPSFCRTVNNTSLQYKFFLAYDFVDAFFVNPLSQEAFRKGFEKITKLLCPTALNIQLYFVKCSYQSHPAWSQNEAMFTGYIDNADYFYRINDDTSFSSGGWTEILRTALDKMKPLNVGVVGPTHLGGNEMILSHDFVHKTHLDIFGFYYPQTFPDWWADDWISGVYGSKRTNKIGSVSVIHTGERGTRYNHSWTSPAVLSNRLLKDRITLDRYLSWKLSSHQHVWFPKGKNVISMSLYGSVPKYTYGAIRNAVLVPQIFPGWVLRVYIQESDTFNANKQYDVPDNIIRKLESHNAEIVYINYTVIKAPPMMWRFLVADDLDVDTFIIRDSDSRITNRDAEVVSEWLETDSPFHCICDHPSHTQSAIFGGLFGGRPRPLRNIINERWQDLMKSYSNDYGWDLIFLQNVIWPRIKPYTLMHDSVSCHQRREPSWPFPSRRENFEHIGQVFNRYGVPRDIDIHLLENHPDPPQCTLGAGESRQSWLLKQKANAHITRVTKRQSPNVQDKVEETLAVELEAKIPSLTGRVVIWGMDYDATYIKDLKALLEPRGVAFIDKSLTADCLTTGVCPHNLSIINTEDGIKEDLQISNRFYLRYKNDAEMAKVTHFICFRPVAMCELYKRFKKSIIVVASHRYEEDRLTPTRWRKLNTNLVFLQGDGRNIIGANNHYDVEYMRYFTGFDPEYLPNYCADADHVTTNQSRSQLLVAPISNIEFRIWFMETLQKTIEKMKVKLEVTYIEDLYPKGYTLSDMAAHRGIIHIPEKVSDMRVCEQYRLAVPLYFPSLDLLSKWNLKYNLLRNRTLSEERFHKHGISISGSPIRAVTKGRFDPNDETSSMSLRYWLRFADFFHLPNVGHFESMEDLVDLLLNTDPYMTSRRMKQFSRKFKVQILSKWINLLNRSML